MPSPLVASPDASPELAQAFAEGARTGAAAYQSQINDNNAADAAVTANAEQIAAEDRAQKNRFALEAYKYQLSAAATKAQTAVEFNKAHWDNVAGQYLSNLAEKQANAETWLDPKNVENITKDSADQARALVSQVQNIYQHVKSNTPVDYSSYHEPADLLNSVPPPVNFTPEFTKSYKDKLQAQSNEAVDKATIEHYKATHPGASDVDARWLERHKIERADRIADEEHKTELVEKKAFDKNFSDSQTNYSSSYGALQSAMRMPVSKDSPEAATVANKMVKTNNAAGKFSAHVSQLGDFYPNFSGVSALWNKNKAKYNGLSTYQDIDAFMNDQVSKIKGAPADDPEVQATTALHNLVYGGGAGQ